MLNRAAFTLLLTVLVPSVSMAGPINLDFSSSHGVPSSTLGAASGQVGVWNGVSEFVTDSGIVDIYGNETGIAITINARDMTGYSGDPVVTEADKLMVDNFYIDAALPWTLSITGLANGAYDIYLYEPDHEFVSSGSGSINGIAFADINGNFNGSFVLGGNFVRLQVSITDGTLTASGRSAGNSGLSAMQLVPIDAQPVPEPASLLLLGTGLMAAVARQRFGKRW